MKFYDITVPLSPRTANWPDGVAYERKEIQTSAIVSTLTIRSHYATHVDAPKHFLFDKQGIDQIAPAILIGKYKVLEVKAERFIEAADLTRYKLTAGDRILFKTRNSNFVTAPTFNPNYVSLGLDAAQYLAKKKVALVGIDYFGIEAKGSPGHLVHKALLSKNIVIVEGVNLKAVKPGTYNGAVLPMKIEGGDGAPARAILWK